MGASWPLAPALDVAPCEPPSNGEWRIQTGTQVTCEDTTIVLRNLTISPLASLTLRNVELVIDAGIDSNGGLHWDNNIDVLGNAYALVPGYGSAMRVYDSTIRAKDPDLRPGGIIVHGAATFVMHDSKIQDFYIGISTTSNVERLEVLRSTISARQDAISSYNSENVLVEDSLFTGPGNGIWVIGASGVIRGNTFTDCTVALYLQFADSSVKEFSHNTVTNCQAGIGSSSCTEHDIPHNDVFRNRNGRGRDLPTWETGICGSAENNWWGETGPDPARMARPLDHTPWRSEPNHPERLPTAAITLPDGPVRAGEPVTLSAAGSRPSETWDSPLVDFEWDLGGATRHGETVAHVFPVGVHEVSLLVTDELGISRMAFAEVRVEPRATT